MLSIIETCKLCGVDAEAYMADVTERIHADVPNPTKRADHCSGHAGSYAFLTR
ncbi:transposase domain-containing protein [Mesorhizobium caraganae]|uniref:transposase domain-containing protein n=1 Tax=Mesorhizobium caraganae TaxID=483206 RepID=UPI0017812338|nr:transposase domain-containing protein [Mesorhizobium caraganae]